MAISFSLKLIGGKALFAALKSKQTIGNPLGKGIRKATLYYERLVTDATPVKTGRLAGSIHSEISPTRGSVATNVQYARFVEYGTRNTDGSWKMEPRHIEGGSRQYGEGMFTFAWGRLLEWLRKGQHDIHKGIDKELD
tara:strand:+ start:2420 stop:2833 length:414 start_codon:yes stop_codon:yes gene_type:complete